MRVRAFIFVLLSLLVSACGSSHKFEAGPEPAQEVSIVTLTTGTGGSVLYTKVTGKLADGSLYAIYLPKDSRLWQRRLAMYAHGYIDPAVSHLVLPDPQHPNPEYRLSQALLNGLIQNGFAFALSSYAHNGWAVKSGFESTERVRRIASDYLQNNLGSRPRHTYIVGQSLGGLISIMLAEKYPDRYSGALPMCGPIGGAPRQIGYLGHVRALFDYYFNSDFSIIPTTNPKKPAINVPNPPPDWPTTAGLIATAVRGNIARAKLMAGVNQIKLPYRRLPNDSKSENAKFIESFQRALFYPVRGTNDFIRRAGGSSFKNSNTTYSGTGSSRTDSELNSGVIRYTPTSTSAVQYAKDYYDTTGKITIPVLALHTTQDPEVPFTHQSWYEQKVKREGTSNWLVRQHVARYGHCNFKDGEILRALEDLLRWAESPGRLLKPAGGDVTQP